MQLLRFNNHSEFIKIYVPAEDAAQKLSAGQPFLSFLRFLQETPSLQVGISFVGQAFLLASLPPRDLQSIRKINYHKQT